MEAIKLDSCVKTQRELDIVKVVFERHELEDDNRSWCERQLDDPEVCRAYVKEQEQEIADLRDELVEARAEAEKATGALGVALMNCESMTRSAKESRTQRDQAYADAARDNKIRLKMQRKYEGICRERDGLQREVDRLEKVIGKDGGW